MSSDSRQPHRRYHRAFLGFLLATIIWSGTLSPATLVANAQVNRVAHQANGQADTQVVGKLQPFLQRLAAEDAAEFVQVIIQQQGPVAPLAAAVTALNGTVIRELPFINAIVVAMPAGALPRLAQLAGVLWIALDAPVYKASATDGSGTNVRDDFDHVTFAGSNGAFAWSTEWTEIGESDGAGAGQVAVTTFWGGALSGLRLEGGATGVMRTFTLQGASEAHLGLVFRRKDFSEQDYLAIEASVDGGQSWQPVANLAGPGTDAELQAGDYVLPTAGTNQLTIRLLTAPTLSEQAKFYVDAVDIRLSGNVAPQQRLFLPLVSRGGEPTTTAATVSAATKAEGLVQASGSQSLCFWQCFDLTALQSTYVKAIGADKLWNTPPYPRGQGVTVAVVDSGISPHPDLNDYSGSSRVIKQVNFVPRSTLPDDFYGHGTHVAGTIAGIGFASGGAYMGVAPEAQLVDVRVTDDYGMGSTSTVVAGLEWIYKNRTTYNIKVANLSLNSTVPESYHKSALNAALEVLWFNQIVVVVSAGNGGKEKLYPPANDPFVITVGATDDKKTDDIADDKLTSFSAYGITVDGFAKPDIVAPGQNIIGLLASDDMNLLKSFPNNLVSLLTKKYFRMSGTSMAAGVVAGAVAVLLEDEAYLTPDQVKYRLMATAKPFTVDGAACAAGAGYLDLYAAVNGTTWQTANLGITASQLLWSGSNPVTWGSVSWNSVSWNSVSWNSVSWNSVSWNSVSWNSVSWNSNNGNNSTNEATGNSCNGAFTDVKLVNGPARRDIQSFYNGAVIDLDAVGTQYITARADTTGAVQSVKFDLNNGYFTKIENGAPYTVYGDTNNTYTAYFANTGPFTLKMQAYGASNLTGALLDSRDYQGLLINSTYKPIIRNVLSNLCLQGAGTSASSGVQLEQRICTLLTLQRFRPRLVSGRPDTVTFTNDSNGLCLDINGASNANGAAAIQWSCSGADNQQFRLKATGNNAFSLVAVHSGKCLAIANSSTSAGAKLIQSTCSDESSQRWRFE